VHPQESKLMSKFDDAPHVMAEDRATWRAWLEANHATVDGAWLVSWRKGTGKPAIPYEEAVEEALCFGWIDSTGGVIDEERARQWYAPRRRGSGWAATNKARIERLIAAGLMTPAGLAVIEAAKADGSWTLLDAVERLEVPPDLSAAFDANPPARANWDAFPRSARRAILEWIAHAKRLETRQKRIDVTATRAARNERAQGY
jgi:uncharacterized protein YdeI (YjbR/CyaY-like superfamily)